jgi:amidohydrolase
MARCRRVEASAMRLARATHSQGTKMQLIDSIVSFADEMTAIRRDIHAHPEIGFREERTSAIVAEKLASWGVEVHRGIGKTGVVGVIRGGHNDARTVGLRADMDALPMDEATDLPFKSQNPGVFHGCGHDGHTTMLLGAARYLAQTRKFGGTVVLIFQPAEEGLGGAKAMLEDGLFARFPCDELYGLHNSPIGPFGQIGIRAGAAMAGAGFFDIDVTGKGAHGAMPENGVDPTIVAVTLAQGLQSIVSRNVSPQQAAVLSITQLHAGTAYNVIPETARLAGTVRVFDDEAWDIISRRMDEMGAGMAAAFGAKIEVRLKKHFSVLRNSAEHAGIVAEVAREMVGEANVDEKPAAKMGSEDFADMLQNVPGAYFWVGQKPGPQVHNPAYRFDDDILPIGASLLAGLAERRAVAANRT